MSANKIQRKKNVSKPHWNRRSVFLFSTILILLCASATLAVINFGHKFNLFYTPLEIVETANGRIIRVPKGGSLQAAVDEAQGGDIVELQAGVTYYGDIKLPKKNITDFITVQTSAISQLPTDKRVSPANANLMAKIVAPGKGGSAISTEDGAHHFRFIGIEFTPDNIEYVYNLIYLNTDSPKLADVPGFFEFDRCYFHPYKAGITRRGIAVNSTETVIKNSYFAGFAGNQEEAQAIAAWSGTKNVKIINNYLEGGAETVLIGGADPASVELIPADIEIRGNYFFKPLEWFGKFTIKNAFEIKNAKRVQFVGNVIENNRAGAAIVITVRNQDGSAPFSTIEDVLLQDNLVISTATGINILGKDDTYSSQTLKRLTIINNLFLDITNKAEGYGGYFVMVSNGEDILIANNTAFNAGNITTFHGEMPKNFLFRDNIAAHDNYGIQGHPNIKSDFGQTLFQNNVFFNSKNIDRTESIFPSGNYWVDDYKSIGFANVAQKDFRLAPNSRFKGKAKNNTDIGSNLSVAVFSRIMGNN
jgi:hypothetical protein